jgi:hypothetical protein
MDYEDDKDPAAGGTASTTSAPAAGSGMSPTLTGSAAKKGWGMFGGQKMPISGGMGGGWGQNPWTRGGQGQGSSGAGAQTGNGQMGGGHGRGMGMNPWGLFGMGGGPARPPAAGGQGVAPGEPNPNAPQDPWARMQGRMQEWQDGRDQRRQDFRDARDQFRGDMRAGMDKFRTDFRNDINSRMDGLGQMLQMPPGFANRLPWNRGVSGASGMGGTIPAAPPAQGVAPGEPNPAAPTPQPAPAVPQGRMRPRWGRF